MAHISTPGTFTLALDADMPSGLIPLATDGLHLTIVGIGGEQRITLNAADRLFDIGASAVRDAPDGSTSLTLGNNITLIGHITGHNNALIRVRDSGRLYMLEGSQIRGHTSTTTSVDSGHGAAVHIAAHGTFTMRGGTITANRASGVTGTNGAGGVFMADADTAGFYMEGGSITGNYRGTGTTAADIFFGQAVNRWLCHRQPHYYRWSRNRSGSESLPEGKPGNRKRRCRYLDRPRYITARRNSPASPYPHQR